MRFNRRRVSAAATIAAIVILALFGYSVYLAFASVDAFAQKGPVQGANVVMTMTLSEPGGLIGTTTELYTGKGPMECGRCGEIVASFGNDGKFKYALVKTTRDEKVLRASYRYASFDGSGVDEGQFNWNGRGKLPATKWSTDALGVSHHMYLVYVGAEVRNKAPHAKRRGVCKQELCGSAGPG